MKLLIEEVGDVQVITEAATDNSPKKYFIEGVFMQAEVRNKNGRKYPLNVLEREVARYNREMISEKRSVGELAHPSGPNINHDRVSHLVTELRQVGNDFMGKAKVLTEMPCGKIVKTLLDEGIRFGVSSRGVGTLRKGNGCDLVEDNYHLAVAADIVADPSAPSAFVSGLMEGKEWIFESGVWRESEIEQAQQEIDNTSRADREAKILKIFENFMTGK